MGTLIRCDKCGDEIQFLLTQPDDSELAGYQCRVWDCPGKYAVVTEPRPGPSQRRTMHPDAIDFYLNARETEAWKRMTDQEQWLALPEIPAPYYITTRVRLPRPVPEIEDE